VTRGSLRKLSFWSLGSAAIALGALAPIVALCIIASGGAAGHWQHLLEHVLPAALRDTAILLLGVGVLSAVIGTGAAWLVTEYDFPGRRILDGALLLPLAVPTYVVAYAYLDILHPVGPVQTALRGLLGVDDPRALRLPDIRSMEGCILLLSFVLYPYVYLPTRAMFLLQSSNLIDTARTLGAGRRGAFFRVALPLARPAIAVGLSLALMEALNDIGASEFLGVRTLTVSVYTTWVTRSNLAGAAQLALAMLAIVVSLVLVERWARRKQRYANDAQSPRPLVPHRLRGARAAAALGVGSLPMAIGFVFPGLYLAIEAAKRIGRSEMSTPLFRETFYSFSVSALATALTLLCGIAVAYAARIGRGAWPRVLGRAASLGYAVPGTVLAIGILSVISGSGSGVLLLNSGVALVYAYMVRFLTVASGGIEAGFSRVPKAMDDVARTLGESAGGRLWRILLPMTRPAMATGALLVFVDCMKELPATLLLRPLGFETLATHLYGEAARGTYEDGAVAAFIIVAVGLIPVLALARVGARMATSSSDARSIASPIPTRAPL
jgi:iron(III) transport system permease protein